MNLLLTDLLDCPNCLTGGGLILLADRVEGRTVHEGRLGCPSCRAHFPVKNGVAEFGAGGSTSDVTGDPALMAALLGVTEPPATILLVGRYEQKQPEQLADMIEGIQVVVADGLPQQSAHPNVSALAFGDVLPLRNAAVRGAWLTDARHMNQAARVCALASRMVVSGITNERDDVEALGFRVIAQDSERLVAVRVS